MKTPAIQKLRQKLAAGEQTLGLWVTLDSASVSEMAVALGLVIWIARKVDFAEGWAAIRTLSVTIIWASVFLLLLQAVLSAWRWCLLSEMIGQRLKLTGATKLFMQSLFYNQALPSPIVRWASWSSSVPGSPDHSGSPVHQPCEL